MNHHDQSFPSKIFLLFKDKNVNNDTNLPIFRESSNFAFDSTICLKFFVQNCIKIYKTMQYTDVNTSENTFGR